MRNTNQQDYYQRRKQQKPQLPKLSKVILVQSISLIICIIVGMILFFTRASFIYHIIGILLTGPIYAINLPYLVRFLRVTKFEINNRIINLNNQVQNKVNTRNPNINNQHSSTSFNYLINSKLSESSSDKPILNRYLLIFSFFTPFWPVIFYFTLFKITKKIYEYQNLRKEVSSLFQDDSFLRDSTIGDNSKFTLSLKSITFFGIVSIISIVGFGITFYIAGVGFFALFWTILLYKSISMYNKGRKSSWSNISKKPKKFPYHMIVAALCFGATAGLIASFTNTLYGAVITPVYMYEPTVYTIILVSVVAPLVEETTKVSGFFLTKEKNTFPLYGWVVLGIFAGLGFALLEDYVYFQRFFLSYSIKDSLLMLLMRLSFPVHLIGSGLAGLGIGMWKRSGRIFHLIVFTTLAVLVHAIFNFLMAIGGG